VADRIDLEGERAVVSLSLDQGLALREGAQARLKSVGLLGELYVELDPGPEGAKPLPEGATIPGVAPPGFDQVLQTASEIGEDVKGVTASLRGALGGDEGERRIDQIIENIRAVSADVRALVATNRNQVDATISNFEKFSATLRDELPRLAEKLNKLADGVDSAVEDNRENLHGALANIRDLSDRLRASADNLNTITGKIARGEGSIGKLVNDETTVDKLNSTLTSVESGVSSLKDTLGRAERWRLAVTMRTENLPGIDDWRTSFGGDLATSERKFFRAGIVSAPQGKRREIVETVSVTQPDGSTATTTTKTDRTTDDFVFNAQAGWLWRNTRLRAGIFENTGGLGVDQALARERAGLTLEAYDFARESHGPHVRFEGRWFFSRNAFAFGGWDDPLWSERSSAIVGAGITWTDDDLKYLLGTASALGR